MSGALRINNGFPVADSFVLEFRNEAEARGHIACDARSILKILEKWSCNAAIIRVPSEEDIYLPIDTVRLMAEFQPVVELFFADTSLPPVVLKAAVEKIEEETRFGIVRLSDQRQVLISSGMAGVLLAGVGIDETTRELWRRPNFWHDQDLHEFDRTWRRELSIEMSGELEYRYRIHKPLSNEPWEWYRSAFRLLRADQGGELFHVGTFIDRG